MSVDASWSDPALDGVAIGWARSTRAEVARFATGGVYLNLAGLDDDGAVRTAAFGHSEHRLDGIRGAYDPTGLFEAAAHRP